MSIAISAMVMARSPLTDGYTCLRSVEIPNYAGAPLPAALVCNGALGGQFGLRLQLFFQIGHFKILGEGAFAPKIAQINPPSARKSAEPTNVGPKGVFRRR
jgi:hypothetical protein